MSSQHCHLSVWTGLFAPQSVVAYFSSTPSEVPCDWKKREVPGQTKCGPSPTPLQGKPCWLQAQITEEGWMWDLYLCSVKVFQEAQTKRLQKQGKHRVASLFSLAGWCLWKRATSADTLTCNRSIASYKYWQTCFHEWPWRTLHTVQVSVSYLMWGSKASAVRDMTDDRDEEKMQSLVQTVTWCWKL